MYRIDINFLHYETLNVDIFNQRAMVMFHWHDKIYAKISNINRLGGLIWRLWLKENILWPHCVLGCEKRYHYMIHFPNINEQFVFWG